ncbi:hypothetical protein [Stappia sp. MMSF_3263]|nr:hypothetical protein [Stappia sp. MMSF_3263]
MFVINVEQAGRLDCQREILLVVKGLALRNFIEQLMKLKYGGRLQ